MYSDDLVKRVKELKNKHGLSMDEAFKLVDMVERRNQADKITSEISRIWHWLGSIEMKMH